MTLPSRDGVLRCLPMWQPWASLVMLGEKKIETRPGRPPQTVLGRRIAIHATRSEATLWYAEQEPFRSALAHHGVDRDSLPCGALLGTVQVVRAEPMTGAFVARVAQVDPLERQFGDYRLGRWAWHVEEPQPLADPVPWKGKQGIMVVPAPIFGLIGDPPPAVQEGTAVTVESRRADEQVAAFVRAGQLWRSRLDGSVWVVAAPDGDALEVTLERQDGSEARVVSACALRGGWKWIAAQPDEEATP